MEGLQVASKGLGPLPRRRGGALARGCGGSGRVVLPLARAAAVSTGLRVRQRHGVVPRGAAVLLDVVGPEAELTRAARLVVARAMVSAA